jgi:hypothetical protein
LGSPHLSIFQPIAPLDAAPQRLYALNKHFKAAADNHNTSSPSLYSGFYGSCRGGFCRGGGSPFRDSTSSAHSEHSPLSSPISILLEILLDVIARGWTVKITFQSFLRFYFRVNPEGLLVDGVSILLEILQGNLSAGGWGRLKFQSFLRFYVQRFGLRANSDVGMFQSFLRFYEHQHPAVYAVKRYASFNPS